MASRRASVSLAKACAPSTRTATTAPARLRAAAHCASRQYHGARPSSLRRPVQVSREAPALLSRSAPGFATASVRRAYSTDAEGKGSKVWDYEALQKLITTPNPSVTIIDVREPGEVVSTGRIPGALNIPVTSSPDSFHITDEEFEDRFGYPRPAPDAEVVFYCRAGVRSRAAAGLARDAGWEKVGEYPGSWADWFERGGKVER